MTNHEQPNLDSGNKALRAGALQNQQELVAAFDELQPAVWDLTRDIVGEETWQQYEDGVAVLDMEQEHGLVTIEAREISHDKNRKDFDEAAQTIQGLVSYLQNRLATGDTGHDGAVSGAHEKVSQKFAGGIFKDENGLKKASNVELHESSLRFTLPDGTSYDVVIPHKDTTGQRSPIVQQLSINDWGHRRWIDAEETVQASVIGMILPGMKVLPILARQLHRQGALKPRNPES